MSDVFISYKSEDRARIQPLVMALETDGLSVWWDARIEGGEHWREVIERELDGARCVVVVWSRRSTGPEGRFVRDEASRAQRRGVYLPVRIDKIDPPLGFGETQALSLVGWKGGRDDPRYFAVLNAIRAVSEQRRTKTGEAASVVTGSKRLFQPKHFLIIALLLIGVIAAALSRVAHTRSDPGNKIVIAVKPLDRLSPDVPASLPKSFHDELGSQLQSNPILPIGITDNIGAPESYVLSGSIRRSGDKVRFLLTLRRNDATLASFPLEVTAKNPDVAPRQAAYLTGAALRCGFDRAWKAGHPLPVDVEQLIFRYCIIDYGLPALQLARQLTARLPESSKAWAERATSAALIGSGPEYRGYRREAELSANKALRLNVKSSTAYNALAILRADLDYAGKEQFYLKAVNAEAMVCGCGYAGYGILLMQVGRIEVAAERLRAASDIIPLDPIHAPELTQAYRLLGNFEASNQIASAAGAMWPDDGFGRYKLRNAFALRQTNAAKALINSAQEAPLPATVRSAYLAAADALASGNAAERRSAADAIEEISRDPNLNGWTVIELLGLLGYDAAAADAMERFGKAYPSYVSEAYSPALAGARRRPELTRLFTELKLVDYWRKTGNKPDFCKTEHTPALCG